MAIKTGPAAVLEHEYRLLQQLSHPAIVRPRDFCASEAGPILVLEYLPGGDLTGLAGGPPARWLGPVAELIGALDCLHAAGVVHRDLKAGNVLLDAGDHARLIDFGSALPVGGAWTDGGTTAAVIAPGRGRGPVAPGDDVHALAVLLHELIHGAPPGGGHQTPDDRLGRLVDACVSGQESAAAMGLAAFRTVIEFERG